MRRIPYLLAITVALAAISTPAVGQMAEPTNLKVLDSKMTGMEVMQVMRGFATGLGVRCDHCHMGEDGQPLSSFDFASDEKEAKNVAREMLRMTMAINDSHIAPLGREDPYKVECVTCHRGLAKPTTLERELSTAYDDTGVAGAIERYASLREEYEGSGAFDFREQPLIMYASDLLRGGKPDEGIQILETATKYFPESAEPHMMLGMTYLSSGDKENAKKHAEAAFAIDPENRRVKRLMQQLESQD